MYIQHNSAGVILGISMTSSSFDPADGTIADITATGVSITDIFDVANGFFKKRYVGGVFVDDVDYADKAANIEGFRSLLNLAGAGVDYGVLDSIDLTQYYTKAEINAMDFGGGGAATLSELTDVDTNGVEDGSFLSYSAANSQFEPTNDLQVKSLKLDTVDATIPGTESSAAQADWSLVPYVLSPKVALARMMGGGPLVNLKADIANGTDWGQIGDNMNDDINWSIQGWTGDVTAHTDYEYELDDHITFDPTSSETVEADVIAAEWVMHDTNSDRYWKFDFTAWTPWSSNLPDAYNTPPGFSYTRTEYSDPTTGTLDPATAVTHTVTGWSDSHLVDIIIDGTDTGTNLSIHRGFGEVLGNPMSASADGSLYDQELSVSKEYPFGTEWAAVSDFTKALDPNLQYSNDFESAVGGNIGNVIVGMKMICHNLDDDKYYGFTFTGWTTGGNGSGWTADVVEIDTTVKTGVIFADGTVQTTLGGNVTVDRAKYEQINTSNDFAPATFFDNAGIFSTDYSYTQGISTEFDHLMGTNSVGMELYLNQYSQLSSRFRFSVANGYTLSTETMRHNGLYTVYFGQYSHYYAFSNYRIDHKAIVNVKVMPTGTSQNVTISDPQVLPPDASSSHGSYTTKLYIENGHSNNATITGTFTWNVPQPTIASGEIWCIEIDTYQRPFSNGLDNVHRNVTNAYKVL